MWSPELYRSALLFAARAHSGQMIPGTELPYIIHCVNVCSEAMHAALLREGTDTDLCIACGLLHDIIEDTGTARNLLREKFGEKVFSGVLALTKDNTLPKEHRMADSLERIKKQPHEIWIVKMADRIVNLAPPPAGWTAEKITAYRDEAVVIFEELRDADGNIASRLLSKINEYGQYITR